MKSKLPKSMGPASGAGCVTRKTIADAYKRAFITGATSAACLVYSQPGRNMSSNQVSRLTFEIGKSCAGPIDFGSLDFIVTA
eukprot:CAMPEP_0185903274 /NCGR_PEP_ID=MMETSP0196C-20130402/2488_1 /TAXON_ID=2932 /ORGANISM="Alexandrium fundyense, Strain CCMP1719" /LENGTH=81 /DNA_ID=CAMNT_0028622285 /DNA_START=67 /DNA_END=309 /DNA_ORIENTATION=-